ncbi:DUF3152 domain-containing protein [Streptomyces sp. NPDC051320]|uniref:DUF3152 domain-containing protein n=1 Tax=Streptomyces sp. NPDC051320 TaxID=3154644 RepID=UPI003424DFAC
MARRSSSRSRSRRVARTTRRRRRYLVGAVALIGLASTAFVAARGGGNDSGAAGPGTASSREVASPTPSASPRSAPSSPAPSASAGGKSKSKGKARDWSEPGNGRFVTAAAAGKSVGKGMVRRYKVQVEEGADVSAGEAAREIEYILADPRGWTADGHDAFQLVADGPYDFEVKIASPATVDKICGAADLDTHGEVNCDVGDQVLVNLKRWDTGSPEFTGPVREYRALIINHEVGHRIGHGHEACPGPGKPAPAMMQQIYGLHGCVANAWPYDSHGTYLGGPQVP